MTAKIFLPLCVGILIGDPVGGRADTVYLQDNTKREGKLIRETETSVVFEEQSKTDKSTSLVTVSKAKIIRIKLSSPEEPAFEQLKRYQLNPNAAYTPEQYDQVMAVFQKFVADDPGSVYAIEVRLWIDQWQFEKDQVARGLIKVYDRRLPRPLWLSLKEAQPFLKKAQSVTEVKRAATLRYQHNTWLTATKAARDRVQRSPAIAPQQREQGLRNIDAQIKILTDWIAEDERQYKTAVEELQKMPDPVATYQAAVAKKAARAVEAAAQAAESAAANATGKTSSTTNSPPKTPGTGGGFGTILFVLLAMGALGYGLRYLLKHSRKV